MRAQEGDAQIIHKAHEAIKRLKAHHKNLSVSIISISRDLGIQLWTWSQKFNACLGKDELRILEVILHRLGNYQGIEDAWNKLKEEYPAAQAPRMP